MKIRLFHILAGCITTIAGVLTLLAATWLMSLGNMRSDAGDALAQESVRLIHPLKSFSAPPGLPPFPKGFILLRHDTIGSWTTAQIADIVAFAFRPNWDEIEPNPGSYQWATTISFIKTAVDEYHKKVTLHIGAGLHSPTWIYATPYNVPQFYFLWGRMMGFGGVRSVGQAVMPVPWNPTYVDLYERMLRALAATIKAMGTSPVTGRPYWDEVFMVHVVGPTVGGAEIMLPRQDGGGEDNRTNPAQGFFGGVHNYAREWRAAGYTPEIAYQAFVRAINTYATLFPDKYLAFDTLPAYLLRNEYLKTSSSSSAQFYPGGVIDAVINYAVATYPNRVTLQADNLNPRTTFRYDYQNIIAFHHAKDHVIVGFQTEIPEKRMMLGGTFRQLIDNGLSFGAIYIEVYARDVVEHPADLAYARAYWGTH